MVQETVRYSDSIVEVVEGFVEEGIFEHKSQFYRFATEMLLDSLHDEYEPEMLDYDTIAEATRQQVGKSTVGQSDGSMFYQSAVAVRRHARRGEVQAAENHIDTHYAPERGERLLLEAVLDYYLNYPGG